MTVSKYFSVQPGHITTIRFLESELFDATVIDEMQDQLLDFVETESPQRLLLDFSNVEFCSTSVINVLLRIKKISMRDDLQLKLCGMKPGVRSAFEMLNLDGNVFDIYDCVTDADAAFQN